MGKNLILRLECAIDERRANEIISMLSIMSAENVEYINKLSEVTLKSIVKRQVPDKWQSYISSQLSYLKSVYDCKDVSVSYMNLKQGAIELNKIAVEENIWILPLLKWSADTLFAFAGMFTTDYNEKLRDIANLVNGSFKIILNDRDTPVAQTKKIGCYFFASMLLRIYFKLRAYSLAEGIMKVIDSMKNMLPKLHEVPEKDQAVFLYCTGVVYLMNFDFTAAVKALEKSFEICQLHGAKPSETVVLMYLLPAKLIRDNQFPRPHIWANYPKIRALYFKIFTACRSGDFAQFCRALERRKDFLIKVHTYLPLLSASQHCLTRLLVRTWKLSGRGKRMSLDAIDVALKTSGFFDNGNLNWTDDDERNTAEELLATLIYDGRIKGAIGHSQRQVALSSTDPFPKLVRCVGNLDTSI